MESTETDFNLNSTNLVILVWSKRKLLLLIGVIAIVVSTIASFMITPKFKATAIIYPPMDNQISKELLSPIPQAGLTVFGESKEMEQLLQVLSSNTLRDLVIKKLDLMAIWGVGPSEKFAKTKVNDIYNDNIRFRPTQYMSVEIEVMDPSPELAAEIANTIVTLEDSLMRSIKAQVALKGLMVVEAQYEQGLVEMKGLEDSLASTMAQGVFNVKAQAQGLFDAYGKAVANNQTDAIRALEKKMEPLKRYGSKNVRYKEEILNKAIQITDLGTSLKTMQIEAAQAVPSQFVVDWASVPDKKAFPKKSIIIILSTLSALLFGVFSIVIADFFMPKPKE
ncbi:MAG: hypothetical protein EHM93_01485 [Bacteroidales bacterium]|nr:MAG: hypothetical protein EHM93_01485 [Bacteroidales bacterium]